MARQHPARHALNAGEVSRYGLYRTDMDRMAIAAETQKNLLPTVMGPAIYRPGTKYIGTTDSNNAARLRSFVYSVDDKALLELTQQKLRIWIDDTVLTRVGVTATVTNGDFATDLASWTDADESGAVSQWVTGSYMELTGTGTSYAIRRQQVTVTETGTEHALRVVVEKGPIEIVVGSSSGGDQYFGPYVLEDGEHSLALTPTGDFHIELRSSTQYPVLVSSCEVESSGVVEISTPWTSGELREVRTKQSADVIFCAHDGTQPRRIERRSARSWSVVRYKFIDGPWRPPNLTQINITPSGTSGQVTLTASKRLFKTGHANGLFALTHGGQEQEATITAENNWTQPIRISGLSTIAFGPSPREVGFEITGLTSTGSTVKLQRSFGAPGAWVDFGSIYTADVSPATTFNDGLDNQIVYYRMGVDTGDYAGGTIICTLTAAAGAQRGVCRIVTVTNATTATADVLSNFSDTSATTDWEESEFSVFRGWPASVEIHDGRLWYGWRDKVYGSVSDDYASFDYEVEGDSGPIQRSVATGAYEGIYWMLSVQRLLCGTASQEVSIRASSFDEPLTPTAFTARAASNRGSMNMHAIAVDSRVIFVQRGQRRAYVMAFAGESGDYQTTDLTRLNPQICDAKVIDIAVQRQPETRIWFVLEDGTCAVLTYEPEDEVFAWTPVTFGDNAFAVSMEIMPGDEEDEIYFVMRRTIDSSTVRYVEKLAKESECVGGTLSKNIDCHYEYSGGSTTTITGLDHLEGEDVVVWANGKPLHAQDDMLTVSSGEITGLDESVTAAIVGLPAPDGEFLSSKLAHAASFGSALGRTKRVDHVGVAMADVGFRGVTIGRDLTNMRSLKSRYRGKSWAATDHVAEDYDDVPEGFNGSWSADSRIAIKVQSPHPCRILGITFEITTSEGTEGLQGGGER